MKITLLKKLIWLAPIALLVIGINLYVDPTKIFQNGNYEKGAAQVLLKGKNVTGLGNCDDRLLQKYYINGLQNKKDIVVLGASNSMFIRSSLFPGKSFFNNSVTMATLKDFVAIYGMYRNRGFIPQTVILGIHSELFTENDEADNWRSLQKEYLATKQILFPSHKENSIIRSIFFKAKKYSQLVSAEYFHASIVALLKGHKYNYRETDSLYDDITNTILHDGSLNYNKKVLSRTIDQVRIIAIANKVDIDRVQLSASIRDEFEAFINLLSKDGVEIVFCLTPRHPKSYSMIRNDSDKIFMVQQYLVDFAAKNNIMVLGSYDAVECHCGEEDFYDGAHLKEQGMVKIFRAMNTDKI